MTTTFQILKRGLLAGALLIVGFGAGWVSAITLGGRIPLDGDISAYLGPGMAQTERRRASCAISLRCFGKSGTWWRASSITAHRLIDST